MFFVDEVVVSISPVLPKSAVPWPLRNCQSAVLTLLPAAPLKSAAQTCFQPAAAADDVDDADDDPAEPGVDGVDADEQPRAVRTMRTPRPTASSRGMRAARVSSPASNLAADSSPPASRHLTG
jgi:hypothetical protein